MRRNDQGLTKLFGKIVTARNVRKHRIVNGKKKNTYFNILPIIKIHFIFSSIQCKEKEELSIETCFICYIIDTTYYNLRRKEKTKRNITET